MRAAATPDQQYTAKIRRVELVEQAIQVLHQGVDDGANINFAIKTSVALLRAAQEHGRTLPETHHHSDYTKEIRREHRGIICLVCGQIIPLSTVQRVSSERTEPTGLQEQSRSREE